MSEDGKGGIGPQWTVTSFRFKNTGSKPITNVYLREKDVNDSVSPLADERKIASVKPGRHVDLRITVGGSSVETRSTLVEVGQFDSGWLDGTAPVTATYIEGYVWDPPAGGPSEIRFKNHRHSI